MDEICPKCGGFLMEQGENTGELVMVCPYIGCGYENQKIKRMSSINYKGWL